MSGSLPCRAAAAKLTRPGDEASEKRVAKSPPDGSHSSSRHRSCAGQWAASTTQNVVTPGEPFRLQTATNIIDYFPTASPETAVRQAWPRLGGRRPRGAAATQS